MPLLQAVAPAWSPAAIHDTVAAIARQPEYTRALRDTLLSRIGNWLLDLLRELISATRGSGVVRWFTTVLVVMIVVLIVVRLVMAARADEGAVVRASARAGGRADPWGDAERLSAAGNFTDAAHLLLAALLLAFAERGEVRLHASKTAGDYARELRRRGSPAHGGFRAFSRVYDRAIYGAGVVGPDDYATLRLAARGLLARDKAA